MSGIEIYDFDGVFATGDYQPSGEFIILTGRCFDESHQVYERLHELLGYLPPVFFNPIKLKDRGNHTVKARTISAEHKAQVIASLIDNGVQILKYYEDDLLQLHIVDQTLRKQGKPLPLHRMHKVDSNIEL